MQGQCHASNPNKNFIFGLKQAEGNQFNPNERFWSQNMWGKSFVLRIKELYKPSQKNPL